MKELQVLFNGVLMGELVQSKGGQNWFRYAKSWLSDETATPISLSMPLRTTEYKSKIVDRYLWGLLPDDPYVLSRWATVFHVSQGNPFGFLRNVGRDVAGAVSFVPAGEKDTFWDESGLIPQSKGDISAPALYVRRHTNHLCTDTYRRGFAAGDDRERDTNRTLRSARWNGARKRWVQTGYGAPVARGYRGLMLC